MQNDLVNNEILNEMFGENAEFIINLDAKKRFVKEELEEVERKKHQVVKKLSEYKKLIKKNTKEYSDYIRSSESVLESIELIFKNLNELQNRYDNIEASLVVMLEKGKANLPYEEIKEKIIKKIDNTVIVEERIKEDNEKNNLIINNFIDYSFENNDESSEMAEFYNLTLENLEDKPVLKIREKVVELPYTKKEIEDFLKTYPNEYKSVQDVIQKNL